MIRTLNNNFSRKFRSNTYNYDFNKQTGEFNRWGTTFDDDPKWSEYGPEILDIEISSGKCSGNCEFCYKSASPASEAQHMTLEQYKKIIDKMSGNLTQVALGITDVNANPDFFRMMEYTRSIGIIPNYTTSGLDMTDDNIKNTVRLCGAVAVSIVHEQKSFGCIRKLLRAGMRYVNIHFMLSEQTLEKAYGVIDHIKNDIPTRELQKITAIVFLQFKPKGLGGDKFTSVKDPNEYRKLLEACKDAGIGCGFDSCSAPMFLKTCDESLHKFVEPCESGLFSSYVSCNGDFFPCSFMEGVGKWENGISMLNCGDFMQDIWNSDRVKEWRKNLIASSSNCDCKLKDKCRSCPQYGISSCK